MMMCQCVCVCVCVCAQSLSCIQLFVTPWTVAHQAPLSMGLSWQEYWSGMPLPPPGDPCDPGIKPASCGTCIAGGWFATAPPGKPLVMVSRANQSEQKI